MASNIEKSLIEVLTQHQAYLYRASSQSVNELLTIFNDESAVMLAKLRDLLDELNDSEKVALAAGLYTTANLKEIRDVISGWHTSLTSSLPEAFAVSATAIAVYEANYTAKLYGGKIKKPNGEKLFTAAKKVPLVGGALVDDLLSKIAESARQKVEYAIRDGISSGKTNQEIVQRIRGSKRLNYEDGLLTSTKSDIDRTVRTVRSHVANQTYLDTFKQLGFEYVKLVATLDGRTSKLCASLDGTVWEINDPAKRVPPLHPNCRSILVPVEKDGQLVGERPFVMDERRVKDIPKDERSQLIGQLDANTTFSEFFKKTDDFFQKEWLGPRRFKLYKEGKFDFDKFFDPEGRLYTLDQLRKLDEQTFKELGIQTREIK
jgi:phage putative head morphogenesis protein, SPP1 gp7 family